MAQYDVDLRDYWRVIRKRKAQILFMVLLVGLCSYGFAKFREPSPLFEAGSAIKIDRFSNLASILTGGSGASPRTWKRTPTSSPATRC